MSTILENFINARIVIKKENTILERMEEIREFIEHVVLLSAS